MKSEDQGTNVIISTWVLTGLSLLFLLLRLFCKFRTRRGLWWDDYLLIASWFSLMASEVLVAMNVSQGTGKHIWAVDVKNLPEMGLRGNIIGTLSILAAVWSKTSFALTLLRLMTGRWVVFIWAVIVSMNILMDLNALFMWLRCIPVQKGWNPLMPGMCWDAEVYPIFGMVAAGYSAAMDFVLAMLPWKILWGLQIKRKEKIGIAVAMSMGIVAGGTAIVKTVEIPTLASGDYTYVSAGLIIWGAAESAVTIMAASIPVLRILVRDVKLSRYYISNGSSDRPKRSISRPSRTSTVIVTSAPPSAPPSAPDVPSRARYDSDQEMLKTNQGGIARRNEIAVVYGNKETGDSLRYGIDVV